LRTLRVDHLAFEGRARVGRLGVLGIGTVGVVVVAWEGGRKFALKIRRTDANRKDMTEEVRLTKMANRIGIGPEIRSSTRDFILMQLVEYEEVAEWLKKQSGQGTRKKVRDLVHDIFNQCRKLDIMGIDHGQLSNLRKHVVVSEGKPWILDFESASTFRRARNLTTAAQYLFIGGQVSPRIRRVLGIRDTRRLLSLLSAYKTDTSDYTFSKILDLLKVA